ncbi:chromosome segregation protein [Bacillus cereus]|nr:chromosome segregation protein [Bacillus cereus]
MKKDNHFEEWNETIKTVYGEEETDSLQVANEGSKVVIREEKELPTIQEHNRLSLINEEQRQRFEVQLVKVEAEKKLVESELKDKLQSAKRKIESLHTRVENGDEIFESDGLQGLGVDIDTLKSRLVSYNQFIIYLKEFGKEINNKG